LLCNGTWEYRALLVVDSCAPPPIIAQHIFWNCPSKPARLPAWWTISHPQPMIKSACAKAEEGKNVCRCLHLMSKEICPSASTRQRLTRYSPASATAHRNANSSQLSSCASTNLPAQLASFSVLSSSAATSPPSPHLMTLTLSW